jgi:hypothetical protein
MTNDVHISEAAEEASDGLSRRRFFAASGATGAAVIAAAYLTRTPGGASTTSLGGMKAAKPSLKKDLDTAAFAASLEVLAVGTYQSALDAANAGKLGSVPPAVATFVQTAKDQHQAHLDALNQLLTTNGRSAVTQPDSGLKGTVDQKFAQVTDAAGAAKLARELEQTAAATYLKAIPSLTPETAVVAGSILCVDQQHVAVLNYALGEYPVPDTFASTKDAASAS